MAIITATITGVIGFIAGFAICTFYTRECFIVERRAHAALIKRKNDEIRRLTDCVNDLQERNAAQIAAFDRITGNDRGEYFKPF